MTGRIPPAASAASAIDRFAGEHDFLSNFHRRQFTFRGIVWPAGEPAFQAFKSLDPRVWHRFATLTPAAARKAGRAISPMRSDWERIKKRVMLEMLLAKFAPGGELAAMLAATGQAVLIEGNDWHDNFWGDCRCGQDRCLPPGLNYLGRLLIAARDVARVDG
jgi:ribA/ribD-fused uncharacterized protein